MTQINLVRYGSTPPTEAEREVLRRFLTGYIDGFTADDKSSWNRFLNRLLKMELGELARVEAVITRNGKFHRKFFVLLEIGFDAWTPPRKRRSYKGHPVQKNFETFREEITIAAGFYEQTFDMRGRLKLKAKSISFAKMEEPEFEQVYSAVADVLLGGVLVRYAGRAELDVVVNQILGMV